jgi:hypothetical protein
MLDGRAGKDNPPRGWQIDEIARLRFVEKDDFMAIEYGSEVLQGSGLTGTGSPRKADMGRS